MQNAFVKPSVLADGSPALVRIPGSWTPLPPEGAFVPLDEYWLRRIRDADVVEAAPPADPPTEPAAGTTGKRSRA